MSDIQDWLDHGHALEDDLSADITKQWEHHWDGYRLILRTTGIMPAEIGEIYDVPDMPRRADWIVDARTRLPKALAALQDVLDMHNDSGDGLCNECSDGFLVNHPCPTVRAIQDAIGGPQ